MKYVALIAVLALLLGLPTIHFQHHFNMPNADKAFITHNQGFFKERIDIRLNDEVVGTNAYKELAATLDNAGKRDTIVFHLAGYGGDGQGMMFLINHIKTTKAHVIMHVEAPVYSAHAYLATAGDELVMDKYTYLMFHTSSAVNTVCALAEGSDRGVSNVEHCEAGMKAGMTLTNDLIDNVSVMTLEEKELIKQGHDVYIFAKEAGERFHKS